MTDTSTTDAAEESGPQPYPPAGLSALLTGNDNGPERPSSRAELHALALVLGLPPMGQRIHVRTGVLQRVADRVLAVAPTLEALTESGSIDATQASRTAELAASVAAVADRPGGAFPPDAQLSQGFEFLWSDALEDAGWHGVRHRARSAFTALRRREDPWIG